VAQIVINASPDNLTVYKESSSYPPTGAVGQGSVIVARNLAGGLFKIECLLVRFFITLPTYARVVSALLDLKPGSSMLNVDNRNIGGQVFPAFVGVFNSGFYLDSFTPDIFSVGLGTTLSAVPLGMLSSIPHNGYLPLRITISGAQPTGKNTIVPASTLQLTLKYATSQQPILIDPTSGSYDKTQPLTLTWQHNDAAGLGQGAYLAEYSTNGGGVWNAFGGGIQTSPNQYHVVAANFFTAGTTVLWRVTTYSNDDITIPSPVSAQASIFMGAAVALPTITAPLGAIGTATPTITWTSSVGTRDFWQARIKKAGIVIYDTGQTPGSALTTPVPAGVLIDAQAYTVEVRIRDNTTVWSGWQSAAFNTVFNPPPIPTISVLGQPTLGKATLTIVNPAPSGGQDTTASNNIWKSDNAGVTWELLRSNWPPNTPYPDVRICSTVPRSYRVVAIGVSGGLSANSSVVSVTVFWTGFFIHEQNDPTGTMLHIPAYNSTMGDSWSSDVKYVQYEGLPGNVALQSEHTAESFDASFIVLQSAGTWPLLLALVKLAGDYVIRTFEGAVFFGKIQSIPRQIRTPQAFAFQVTLHLEGLDKSKMI